MRNAPHRAPYPHGRNRCGHPRRPGDRLGPRGPIPTRSIRYINPFPAGGGYRHPFPHLLRQDERSSTGQQWIVENKGGSGGNVGMDALAQSAARRLHAGPRRHRQPRHLAHPLCQAAVQREDRLHLRVRRSGSCPTCWWSISSLPVKSGGGADRIAAARTRASIPMVRPARARRSTSRASCSRCMAKVDGACAPIAAARRRCRTCWPGRST